jgi:hypothetical protein
MLMGVVLLLTSGAIALAVLMRGHRARRKEMVREPTGRLSETPPPDMGASLRRCWALIAEALVVRQRLSGEIDAETYQARMNDLARDAIPARRPQRNA